MGLSKLSPELFDLEIILGFLGGLALHPQLAHLGADPEALSQGK